MLELIPESDGRVALVRTHNGTLLGYARNQAEAEDVAARYEQILRELAPIVWELGRELWKLMTPEQRARYNRSPEDFAKLREMERAEREEEGAHHAGS
jgi:hypothetical protein